MEMVWQDTDGYSFKRSFMHYSLVAFAQANNVIHKRYAFPVGQGYREEIGSTFDLTATVVGHGNLSGMNISISVVYRRVGTLRFAHPTLLFFYDIFKDNFIVVTLTI